MKQREAGRDAGLRNQEIWQVLALTFFQTPVGSRDFKAEGITRGANPSKPGQEAVRVEMMSGQVVGPTSQLHAGCTTGQPTILADG